MGAFFRAIPPQRPRVLRGHPNCIAIYSTKITVVMENTDTKNLSFPQRNWFLLCVLVAILSPLIVHWVQAGARHENYEQSINTRPPSTQPNNPATSGGAGGTDSSYKVATPPATPAAGAGNTPAGGAGAPDSSKK